MTSVVSDLMGQRVIVRFRDYNDKAWLDIVTGIVRGVAQHDTGSFAVLLEIVELVWSMPGFGMHEMLPHALVTFSTEHGRYEGGHVAIVVLRESP